jgi:hypothetical protein
MAMFEAVQTRTSTFGIWAIIVVAVVCLAVWLVGISVADNMQARESRRWWRRLHAPEPALDSPEPALGGAEPTVGSAGPLAVPGQRRGEVRGASRSVAGQDAVVAGHAAAGRQAAASQQAVTEPIPAQGPAPEPETAGTRGRHASQPTLDGAGDFRRDSAEADWRAEPPTRPDLPAQADGPARGAPTGRHAMPIQRTGDADRAERSLAGPDPAREDEDPGQR